MNNFWDSLKSKLFWVCLKKKYINTSLLKDTIYILEIIKYNTNKCTSLHNNTLSTYPNSNKKIVDYNKEKLLQVKTSDQTCAFFIVKDSKYKDNLGALSSAIFGIINYATSYTTNAIQQL